MGLLSVLPDNNLLYAHLPPGGLNAEKISSASTDVLKLWMGDRSLSAQEKQAVLAELVRRAKEAKSSSTGPEEGSLESLLLKLSERTISDEEKKKLAEALGIEPKDLDELSSPDFAAPPEGGIH